MERLTDELAGEPLEAALDSVARTELSAGLDRVADAVVASGTLPFPNPMGLPPPAPTSTGPLVRERSGS